MPGYTYQPTTKTKKAPETQFADTLQTTENLKQQASPLTNALAPVNTSVKTATQQAGQQATNATTAVNTAYDKPAVGAKIIVNQSAYATTPQQNAASTAATPTLAAKPVDIASALGIDLTGKANQEAVLALQNQKLGTSADADIAQLSQQAADEAAARDVQVKNLTDTLTQKQLGQGYDTTAEGGSLANANIGELGQLNALEQEAIARQAAIANGAPTSNYDALSAALGGSFDPRLAAMESQIYNTDLQKMKGQAQADYAQQEQANAQRTGAIGNYKKSLESALTNTQDVATEKQKEADLLLKNANQAAKDTAQAKVAAIDKQIKDVSALPAQELAQWTDSVKTLAVNDPNKSKHWEADSAALSDKTSQQKVDGTSKIAQEINTSLKEKQDLLTNLQNKIGVPAEVLNFVQGQVNELQAKSDQAKQNINSYKQVVETEKAAAAAKADQEAYLAKWKLSDDKAYTQSLALAKGETDAKQSARLEMKVIPSIDKDIASRKAELLNSPQVKADPTRATALIKQIDALQKRKAQAQNAINAIVEKVRKVAQASMNSRIAAESKQSAIDKALLDNKKYTPVGQTTLTGSLKS